MSYSNKLSSKPITPEATREAMEKMLAGPEFANLPPRAVVPPSIYATLADMGAITPDGDIDWAKLK
jgi:hypothetical protein